MINNRFENLFGHKTRIAEQEELKEFHMDIAASIQSVLEEIIIKICKSIKEEFKIENICLAGGVALNCVANGKILKKDLFENIWVQPAAGDAGGALGACYVVWHQILKKERIILENTDKMKGSYLGNSFEDDEIMQVLKKRNIIFEKYNYENTIEFVSNKIIEGKLLVGFKEGWNLDESLGNRSILADARNPEMQKNLNLKLNSEKVFVLLLQ